MMGCLGGCGGAPKHPGLCCRIFVGLTLSFPSLLPPHFPHFLLPFHPPPLPLPWPSHHSFLTVFLCESKTLQHQHFFSLLGGGGEGGGGAVEIVTSESLFSSPTPPPPPTPFPPSHFPPFLLQFSSVNTKHLREDFFPLGVCVCAGGGGGGKEQQIPRLPSRPHRTSSVNMVLNVHRNHKAY